MNGIMRTLSRRRFLQIGLAATAAALLPRINPTFPLPLAGLSSADRAVASYNAQQAYLYRPNVVPGDTTSLYLDQTPQGNSNPYAYVWPFSQAMAGALDLLALPSGDRSYALSVQNLIDNALPNYWDGTAYQSYVVAGLGPGGDRYYDDNAWVGLNLVRANRVLGNDAALKYAALVFQFLIAGWDQSKTHSAPGGIFWVEAKWNRGRNTCSNAPVAELALRLYQVTQQTSYLSWAMQIYDWVNATLLADNGLYWDHIDLNGNIDTAQSSCNQGAMIGASVLLHNITKDPNYLDRARSIARAALTLFGRAGYAAIQHDFNPFFFRNLLLLSTVDSTFLPETLQSMQQYADDVWARNRNDAGLFPFPAGSRTTTLLNQSAMVQIFACMACDPAQYDLLV